MASEPQELKLTPDLLEYAKAVAIKEAPKHCQMHLSRPTGRRSEFDEKPWDDVVQQVILQLLRRPPKYDPSRGASPKTLIYIIVVRALMKYGTREHKLTEPLQQFDETVNVSSETPPGLTNEQLQTHQHLTGKGPTKHEEIEATVDDMLRFIDSEDSRALCKLVIECQGNMSKAAKRLGLSEGTVRHRLKMLGPKLLAAGFNPFATEEET